MSRQKSFIAEQLQNEEEEEKVEEDANAKLKTKTEETEKDLSTSGLSTKCNPLPKTTLERTTMSHSKQNMAIESGLPLLRMVS